MSASSTPEGTTVRYTKIDPPHTYIANEEQQPPILTPLMLGTFYYKNVKKVVDDLSAFLMQSVYKRIFLICVFWLPLPLAV